MTNWRVLNVITQLFRARWLAVYLQVCLSHEHSTNFLGHSRVSSSGEGPGGPNCYSQASPPPKHLTLIKLSSIIHKIKLLIFSFYLKMLPKAVWRHQDKFLKTHPKVLLKLNLLLLVALHPQNSVAGWNPVNVIIIAHLFLRKTHIDNSQAFRNIRSMFGWRNGILGMVWIFNRNYCTHSRDSGIAVQWYNVPTCQLSNN